MAMQPPRKRPSCGMAMTTLGADSIADGVVGEGLKISHGGVAGVLRAAGTAIPVDQSDPPDLQCLSSPHHELVEPRLGGPDDFRVHRLDQPVDR